MTFLQRDVPPQGIRNLGGVNLGLEGVSWKQVVGDIKVAGKRWRLRGWKGRVTQFF
jgi:hypothetical protein